MKLPRLLLLLMLAGAVVAAAWYWQDGVSRISPAQARSEAQTQPAVRRLPVETAVGKAARTTADIRAVGSLQSDESVKIAPEIAGRVAELPFTEGQPVKKGEVLVRLDDALARGEVDQATARHELAKANLDRAKRLARTGAGTEQREDEATAEFTSSRAALELAKVRLAKHTITAPFPGVVGIRNVSVGAFVAVGTEIVNFEKVDTLKVSFKVPETFLADVATGQNIEVGVDALPARAFPGTIYAINPMVDVNGRALEVRARLPNADRILRPGLFARVVIKGRQEQNVVLIPESALVPRGGDIFVYRVDGGKAIETKVRLGERKAGDVAILEGIGPETVVVTAGHHRLRDGAAVEAVEAVGSSRSARS